LAGADALAAALALAEDALEKGQGDFHALRSALAAAHARIGGRHPEARRVETALARAALTQAMHDEASLVRMGERRFDACVLAARRVGITPPPSAIQCRKALLRELAGPFWPWLEAMRGVPRREALPSAPRGALLPSLAEMLLLLAEGVTDAWPDTSALAPLDPDAYASCARTVAACAEAFPADRRALLLQAVEWLAHGHTHPAAFYLRTLGPDADQVVSCPRRNRKGKGSAGPSCAKRKRKGGAGDGDPPGKRCKGSTTHPTKDHRRKGSHRP
jgi:hypothetical protein